jgi:hypothetical protein
MRKVLMLILVTALSARAGDGRRELSQSSWPVTITNGGSYVLTENISGTNGAHGVVVAADDVTLDLNGFTIAGLPGSLNGIHVAAPVVNLTVQGGLIRGWGGNGISAAAASNSAVRGVQVRGSGGHGMELGTGAQVFDCVVANSGQDGIRVGGVSQVGGCQARNSGGHGIVIGTHSSASDCTARENGGSGIVAAPQSLVLRNAVRDNRGHGVVLEAGCLVADAAAYTCVSNGIHGNALGVNAQRVTTFGNGGAGVSLQGFSMVQDSTARQNTNGGFRIGSNGFILRCAADQSVGGGGFVVSGTGTRIDQVHATRNAGSGIVITGTNNLVVMNTAYGNTPTNYAISATNNYYEIVINPTNAAGKLDQPWSSYDLF